MGYNTIMVTRKCRELQTTDSTIQPLTKADVFKIKEKPVGRKRKKFSEV